MDVGLGFSTVDDQTNEDLALQTGRSEAVEKQEFSHFYRCTLEEIRNNNESTMTRKLQLQYLRYSPLSEIP